MTADNSPWPCVGHACAADGFRLSANLLATSSQPERTHHVIRNHLPAGVPRHVRQQPGRSSNCLHLWDELCAQWTLSSLQIQARICSVEEDYLMNALQSWCGCEDAAGRRTSQSGNTDRPSIARRISCLSENRGCEGDRGHSQLAGTALSAGMRAFIQMTILKDHLLKYLVSNAIRCVFYTRDILAKTWALG